MGMLTHNNSLSPVKRSNMLQLASSIYIQQKRMEEVVVVYVMMEHGDGYKNSTHMIRFAKVTTAIAPPNHAVKVTYGGGSEEQMLVFKPHHSC